MWTPKWFDALFMLLMHPGTWAVVGIVLGLLVVWVLWAVWRAIQSWVARG